MEKKMRRVIEEALLLGKEGLELPYFPNLRVEMVSISTQSLPDRIRFYLEGLHYLVDSAPAVILIGGLFARPETGRKFFALIEKAQKLLKEAGEKDGPRVSII